MEHIAEIRRRHFISKESISAIANNLNLSRQTVRKALRSEAEPYTNVKLNQHRN